MTRPLNIADRLRDSATRVPAQRAVVCPHRRDHSGRIGYTHRTFQQIDEDVDRVARGLIQLGVQPGMRLVLMVRPSLEFITLTFGIFRSGAVCTLVDPGMGRSQIFRCLEEVEPDGFLAIPLVHVIRRTLFHRFRSARFNICTGRCAGLLGCKSWSQLLQTGSEKSIPLPLTNSTDPAAIIFTSGSTGPPKGVLYEHGMFDAQVDLIRNRFGIRPGEIDLPGFPLFALFNLAMQVTTVIPDMNPARPADVNPERILETICDQGVTQAFGSPAMWNAVGRYCETQNVQLPTVRRILSAGAPVPNHVLRRMTNALPEASDIFTPYGATECLPVAAIGGREVLRSMADQTATGAGTCVGRVFDQMDVKIIETTFDPIPSVDRATVVPLGEIGEIIVRGPVATKEYFRRPDAVGMAKIPDGESFWHRMGDVGYQDGAGRLWFCGRKTHIVFTQNGPLYTVPCEAIFNAHERVYRSALVGCGPRGEQIPTLVVEPEVGKMPATLADRQTFRHELTDLARRSPLTHSIREILFRTTLPVDTRHNVKIRREELAVWAASQPRN